MTRKPAATHTRIPPTLAPVLRRFVERYGEPERWARTEIGRPWVVVAAEHVGYLAHDETSLNRLQREIERARWAAEASIPVPTVVHSEPDILVTERVPQDPIGGQAYVRLAIAAAAAIAAASPPALQAGAGARRASRRNLPLRVTRLIAGGIDPRAFFAAKRAVGALPHDELSHGDFHTNNLLYDRGGGAIHVIDWSYLGYQPQGSDLAYFWCRLRDAADRKLLLDELTNKADDERALGIVLRWTAMRTLADILTASTRRHPDPAEVAHARLVLREANAAADALGGRAGAS